MTDQTDFNLAFSEMSLDDKDEVPITKERKTTSHGILKKFKPKTCEHKTSNRFEIGSSMSMPNFNRHMKPVFVELKKSISKA
jgi:hypothetical protein